MTAPTVSLVTLGCGRNEVDSDQVAGQLELAGLVVTDDPGQADCVLVNTCTFIEPARMESIETILAACDDAPRVVVMGCMAERYGSELAAALPEVASVVGFADYPRLAEIVADVIGQRHVSGGPEPPRTPSVPTRPPTAAFPVRTQPKGVWAYLKIAGGCDRACTFCTIPSYRGSFRSRPLPEIVAEARWLAEQGVRELVCVSENTTSWSKDLPEGRAGQVDLVRSFETVEGLERVRLLYLQPDELRPELLDAMAASPAVAGYYDLSLQHASEPVLARMARSGSAERFLELIAAVRARDPGAVFRSSFIVGFPGETEADVDVLEQFLAEAALDWTGFFTYSPEDGTPSAAMPHHVPEAEARARRDRLVELAEAVADERAAGFVGRDLRVLVEEVADGEALGRSYREAPDTDGEIRLGGCDVPVGGVVTARVTAADGVDLLAEVV